MILAEKIVRLRKQIGWSQEELAEKMNVSRQSVSKWEATNSIPDLNKIIILAELFSVSTDYLLKDEVEIADVHHDDMEPGVVQVSLEQALKYVDSKLKAAALISKGVVLFVCSAIPMFFLLAMVEANQFSLTKNVAAMTGIIIILIIAAIGISFFIRANQYEGDIVAIEKEAFELAYGVHSVFKEKLQKYRGTYNLRLSLGICMFILSAVPLLFVSMLSKGSDMTLMTLNVMLFMIATGIYILMPVSAKYEAFNNILKENSAVVGKSRRAQRAEKLAAFYFPFITAIYIGWSLWTMDWHITWILWPVGVILYAALLGLMELLDKEDR